MKSSLTIALKAPLVSRWQSAKGICNLVHRVNANMSFVVAVDAEHPVYQIFGDGGIRPNLVSNWTSPELRRGQFKDVKALFERSEAGLGRRQESLPDRTSY